MMFEDMADEFVEEGLARGWFRLGNGRPSAYGPPLACRHCGSSKVFWQKVHNRKTEYAMHDIDSLAEHNCLAKLCTPEGFDDV